MIQCEGEVVEPHKLVPNPRNNNKHSKRQIDALAKLLDYQGQRSPIVVSNQSGFVVKGHCTLQAIKKLGWPECAVSYQDFENEAQEYAHMTADNEIARWASFDIPKFKLDLKEIDIGEFDPELYGLKNFKLVTGDNDTGKNYAQEEWEGMPECESEDKGPKRQILVSFASDEDVQTFGAAIGQTLSESTRYIWYPKQEREMVQDMAYDQ